jgi:hypothetical protein
METNQNNDLFGDRPKAIPGMLNVLTILTFIGCAFAYIGTIYSFITSSDYEKQIADLRDRADNAGDNGLASKMLQDSIQMIEKSHEYRYVLVASGLIFATLCLVGALRMRKLKKSGFLLYTIGELAPLVLTAALIGFTFFSGIVMALSGLFAIVFVILYATQTKYMTA